ncbi:DegT/DnrJ/EryC1/StrS family aminotransferase [bacterium (Candidatus Gribaldobacteria) CG08_land_8_20_14_0_20_39_15]|uniref:DegT/DnrJ/EryC1/StrS family aminotransferase n=1 Tax=bacterium (Candidatus Gribaldobacteria) CG08_land_8_20_14_0_20_39_15 TaxID=2014273 RepID=A0A2M6XUC5_9BACT|nr:MAG: DegT/DnrJ/EryC1/StrS family aminotransferase [bacterium (Candidatus Gribaldobacteria) CG08_land_8_20_14_0_20_39_15]
MKIPLFKIYSDNQDIKAITEAIKAERNWAIGPQVEQFEKKLASYLGVKYALVFNSGTSALHGLMLALGIGLGDEVIVPSFTFIATANAPIFVGAKPVFAEIESKTFGLDPADVEKKITKKTKAIMPIHYGGSSCQIKALKKIAQKHHLFLIEDAAESLGAKVGKQKVGSFGQAAILSFCQNKIITTGEGGAVVTNSPKIYEWLKLIRSHGRREKQNYFSSTQKANYVSLGYNFRMSNIAAALGVSQLQKIDKIIAQRRKNAAYLNKKLNILEDKIVLPGSLKNYFHVFQMYTIMVKDGEKTRNNLKNYLEKNGITAKIYFDPVHLSAFYRRKFAFQKGALPITEKIAQEALSLPLYPGLTQKEMDYIANNLISFFRK